MVSVKTLVFHLEPPGVEQVQYLLKCGRQPDLLRTCQRRSLLKVLKALVKSMKAKEHYVLDPFDVLAGVKEVVSWPPSSLISSWFL